MSTLLSLFTRLAQRAFDGHRAVGDPEHFAAYLASIPFVNGDAWEVIR